MELPLAILRDRPPHPVVTVDGVLGAPGLELSHWPGNRTPVDLAHELSTGCALAFARLAPEERVRRAAGATAIANTHYDTDGVCAAFAVRWPREALARADRLLAAAAAGDFFQVPDEEAVAIDLVVQGLADRERSPFAAELAGLDDRARHELSLRRAVELLPTLLDGDLEPWRPLWEASLEHLRADLADLARCARREAPALDLCLWAGPHGARASRDPGSPMSPGRHALFGSTALDRALCVTPGADGWTWRLVVSSRSWFDLPGVRPPRRPDLVALAARLNEREGTAPGDACAWRAQPPDHPSPELWFGGSEHPDFAEHADVLAPSRLDPVLVLGAIHATLGASRRRPARRVPRPAALVDPG